MFSPLSLPQARVVKGARVCLGSEGNSWQETLSRKKRLSLSADHRHRGLRQKETLGNSVSGGRVPPYLPARDCGGNLLALTSGVIEKDHRAEKVHHICGLRNNFLEEGKIDINERNFAQGLRGKRPGADRLRLLV